MLAVTNSDCQPSTACTVEPLQCSGRGSMKYIFDISIIFISRFPCVSCICKTVLQVCLKEIDALRDSLSAEQAVCLFIFFFVLFFQVRSYFWTFEVCSGFFNDQSDGHLCCRLTDCRYVRVRPNGPI